MQIVRTVIWVLLLVALLLFSITNWDPTVTVRIWDGIVVDTKIPAIVIVSFAIGFVPMWLYHRASKWRTQRKIASQAPLAIRLFRLMYLLSGSVIVFGILGAGFFGMELSEGNPLVKISVMDYGTQAGQKDIMIFSILIGMVHICIAQAIKCYRERDFSGIGWIIAIWGAFFYLRSNMAEGVHNQPAMYVLIVGLTVVFLFSSKSKNPLLRVAEGFLGLLGVIQIFSDVLSYLRLFALGVATVYIAQTFNILGGEVANGLPVIGFVFAGIILFIGHTLNIGLAIMGGVIHGLRLNFLEWYRWCFEGDGLEYKPFQRIGER